MIWPESEPDERLKPALWIGLGGAALAALFALLLPHEAAFWELPRVLKERVAISLSSAGFPGLDVQMDGQRARLQGIVESEPQIAAARRAALTAAGPGGGWAGGITSVDVSGVHVGAFERPFVFTARRSGARIVLSGAVPSENVRAQVLQAARSIPNAQPIDQLHVAGGAPSPLFGDIAAAAVGDLREMRDGQVRIVDGQIALVGEGAYADVEALRRDYAALPAPFRARVDALSDGLDLAHPELQGVNLATGGAPACAQAFARLTEQRNVRFAANGATIDPTSRALLDSLASVALHCDSFAVGVHGPAQGGAELSRQRAQAVTAYFISQGVLPGRLNAVAGGGGGVTFDVAGGPP